MLQLQTTVLEDSHDWGISKYHSRRHKELIIYESPNSNNYYLYFPNDYDACYWALMVDYIACKAYTESLRGQTVQIRFLTKHVDHPDWMVHYVEVPVKHFKKYVGKHNDKLRSHFFYDINMPKGVLCTT